jgi:hypothetical protein
MTEKAKNSPLGLFFASCGAGELWRKCEKCETSMKKTAAVLKKRCFSVII